MLMGALVGGMLGLLGGLLGEGFARFLKHISGGDEVPKWPRVIGVILAVTLTRPAIEYINKPTAETVMRELETKEPIYLVLKQKTPDVYAKIMSDIDTSIKSGDGAAAIRMKIQSEMRLIYSEKLPHASDASLLGWVQLVRDEERSLDAADPSLCVAMLSGQGGDVSSTFSEELKKRDNILLTQIVSEPVEASVPNASVTEAQSFIIRSAQIIAKKLNLTVQDVGTALQGQGSDHLRCQVSSELMDAFTTLPAPAAGPMIRAVMFSK